MSAGLPKYNVVNLSDLDKSFEAGATVTLEALSDKHLLNISGREARLPLKVQARCAAAPRAPRGCAAQCSAACARRAAARRAATRKRQRSHPCLSAPSVRLPLLLLHLLAQVLGEGELSKPLTIQAASFSGSALTKIEAAGATATKLAGRKKWTRKAHEKVRASKRRLAACIACF